MDRATRQFPHKTRDEIVSTIYCTEVAFIERLMLLSTHSTYIREVLVYDSWPIFEGGLL